MSIPLSAFKVIVPEFENCNVPFPIWILSSSNELGSTPKLALAGATNVPPVIATPPTIWFDDPKVSVPFWTVNPLALVEPKPDMLPSIVWDPAPVLNNWPSP